MFQICREEENLKTFLSIIHDRLNAEEYQHYLDRWLVTIKLHQYR